MKELTGAFTDQEAGMEDAVYLFCVAGRDAVVADGAGIDGQGAVRMVAEGNLAAVVCGVRRADWTGETGETHTSCLDWVGPRACRHEQVLEQVMALWPVCPARFGTLFSSEEQVRAMLREREEELVRFLRYAADKEEWEVRLEVERVLGVEWLVSQKRARGTTPGTPGARYLRERQLRSEAEAELQARLMRLGEEVERRLAEVAVDKVVLHRFDRCEERGVLAQGWALLIPKARGALLVSTVEEARAGLPDEARCRVSGPWPPHHFCRPDGWRSWPARLHARWALRKARSTGSVWQAWFTTWARSVFPMRSCASRDVWPLRRCSSCAVTPRWATRSSGPSTSPGPWPRRCSSTTSVWMGPAIPRG